MTIHNNRNKDPETSSEPVLNLIGEGQEKKELDIPPVGTGHDKPDSRDITNEDIETGAGDSYNIPERVILDITKPVNQGKIGCCSVAGSSMAYYETLAQFLDHFDDIDYETPFDFWKVWEEAKKRGASDTGGWYLQSALQLLKDLGHTGGYVRNKTGLVEVTKRWIYEGKGVATGMAHGDWGKIMQTGEFVKTTAFTGHIFAIMGYDDNYVFMNGKKGGFWVPNSWGGRGGFWISYEDAERELYSQYIEYIPEETEELANARKSRKSKYLKTAYERGIWNEERANEIASAKEIRIMVNRALRLDDDFQWLRKMVAVALEDKVLRGKDIILYNKERQYEIASDVEFSTMYTRAVMRNKGINELTLSREQVAERVVMDFIG